MANVDQALPRKGPSFVIQVAMLLLMTVAAVGMGWLSGAYLKGEDAPKPAQAAVPKHDKPEAHGEEKAGEETAAGPLLVELMPITTNLASPEGVWLRLEASVLFDAPQPPELAEQIHQDFLALIRTLKLHQIEGASGYQHLRADLQDRAAIRSAGHVKEVLVRTLLLE